MAVLDRGRGTRLERGDELGGVEVADPVGADPPLLARLGQDAERLVQWDVGIELVSEVQVDALDAEALEA